MVLFNIERQALFCLVVMIVTATIRPRASNDTVTSGQPGDLPTASNDTVTSGQPGDLPAVSNDTVTSGQPGDLPAVSNDTVTSGQPGDLPTVSNDTDIYDLESLIAAVHEEANRIDNEVNDFWNDQVELMNKIRKHREEMMTARMKAKLVQIMYDIADYNGRMKDFGDVNDTIRNQCGEDVLSNVTRVLEHFEEDVTTVLTGVALLQLHGCPSAAANITSQLLEAVGEELPETVGNLTQGQENENDTIIQERDNEDDPSTDAQQVQNNNTSDGLDVESQATVSEDQDKQNRSDDAPLVGRFDHCDHVAECQRTGIPAVRQQLAGHTSLRAVYDVVVAAVFASTHSENVSKPLLDGVIADFNVTSPDFNVTRPDFNVTNRKRSSCVEDIEGDVHFYVTLLPVVSGFYNLASAVVYYQDGCTDIAKSRAIGAVVDFALDAATIATSGAAAPAASSAKTGLESLAKSAGNIAKKAVGEVYDHVIGQANGNVVKSFVGWAFGKRRSVRGAMRVPEKGVKRAANTAAVNRDRV